jgi:ubiquinone/menaquinone biosynthesis C-methylase UbiE
VSKQKDVFLASEGDAWYARNETALSERDWTSDPIVTSLGALAPRGARVLEVGCGEGSRLEQLQNRHGFEVTGIDPSAKAVARANARGVRALQSTADTLAFPDASFDVVIFGFCLYLCDDADLFTIAREADRVLATPAWLLIMDFHSASPLYRPYHHSPGMHSRKMDYSLMFRWHPSYTLAGFDKFDHQTLRWTDEPSEWVSLSCLRKCAPQK